MDQEKLQELQILEQNMQNILMQKQSFQLELNETNKALKEIDSNEGDEIYKSIGNLMLKVKKSDVKDELENKKKVLEMRIQTFEKQEKGFEEKVTKIRDEILSSEKKQ